MRDSVEILVIFPDPERSTIHRVRNFGEEVWGAYRENNRVHVDLDVVDSATDRIRLMVRRGNARDVRKHLAEIIERHMMTGECFIPDAQEMS